MQAYTTNITINAPASRIWEVMTRPEHIKQVLDVELVTDWKVGGSISYIHNYEGQIMRDKGTILALEEPGLLKLAYLPAITELEDLPENYQTITAESVEVGTVTTLTITVENIKDEFFMKHAPEVWGEVLRGLKVLAEA